MRNLTTVQDIGNRETALEKARYVKQNPYADSALGKNKTL